jgi:FkbM family methyltransferase
MNRVRSIPAKVLRQLNALAKRPKQRRALEQFHAVTFTRGDVAIDCGANVGDVSLQLAGRGATVYAFEPNPDAYEVLTERTRALLQVHCFQQAVADHSGSLPLYLHRNRSADPLYHSAGSSLVAGKHNLDDGRYIDVSAIDLAEFIADIPGRVRLLKIDVEGYEAILLNHLIDRGVLRRIDHVFCETHEFKMLGLASECRRLRRRLAAEGLTQVNLDWS